MSTVTCRIGSDMASLNGFKALVTFFREAEHAFTTAALLGMGLLPILELFLRTFCNTGIPGTSGYVQNLTMGWFSWSDGCLEGETSSQPLEWRGIHDAPLPRVG